MKTNLGPSPNYHALELARTLSAATKILADPPTVEAIRQDQNKEFLPRAERTASRFDGTVEQQEIAGWDCLVLTPAKRTCDAPILYFFGGGYVSGSPECDLPLIAPLADNTGAQIVAPRYPLAPEHPFPVALDCAETVYLQVIHSRKIGSIAVVGESAGGGLAMALTNRLLGKNRKPPTCLCLFSPWVDLSDGAKCFDANDPSMSNNLIRFFQGLYAPAPSFQSNFEISPALGDFSPNFPPSFITSGTRDAFVSDLEAMNRRLIKSGCDTEFHVWNDLWHVFELYDELPEAAISLKQAARFLLENCNEI